MAMGFGGGHPATTTDFPQTCEAIAEICAFCQRKGTELGGPRGRCTVRGGARRLGGRGDRPDASSDAPISAG